jgi:WD40 repeat protein
VRRVTAVRVPPREQLPPRWRTRADDYVTGLSFSGDGALLAVADASGAVHVLGAGDGQVRRTLAAHDHGVMSLAFHPRRPLLATGGQDGVGRLWQLDADRPPVELGGDAQWVEHLAWSPDGDLLVTASGRVARVWKAGGAAVTRVGPHTSTISGVAWSRGGDRFAASCYGGISIWSARAGKRLRTLEWKGSLLSVAWSPGGNYIACGCQDASVHLWRLTSGEDSQMHGYPQKVEALTFDAKGDWLATAGGVDIAVWDLRGAGPEGREPVQLGAHSKPVRALTFARAGLASGGDDGMLCLWRPGRGDALLAFARHDAGISRLAWHPDGTCIAAGDADGGVALWDLHSLVA